MKRYGVSITFDYEVGDVNTPDDIEAQMYDLFEGWDGVYRLDVTVGEPEFEAR